jgi:hypothetical protein
MIASSCMKYLPNGRRSNDKCAGEWIESPLHSRSHPDFELHIQEGHSLA